jgi:acyl-coenzyme A synthetase/AMP-(fatty) acid ligase
MAWRRTIASEQWTVMDDIRLTAMSNGSDGHPADEQNVRLDTCRSIKQFLFNDVIELVDGQHFILKGRKEDLINLAGKRTSLAYLNHHLQSCNALLDGCFYQDDSYPEGRLVAFVVLTPSQRERVSHSEMAGKQTILAIRAHLKNKIEPVFLPKKIYFVNALPRNATGKLPLSELEKLLQQLLQEQEN